MPLYITKTVVDRLVGRFALNLSRLREGLFFLSPVVVPTTDTDALLRTLNLVEVGTINITGTGHKVVATVPLGKRWRVHGMRSQLATGTFTLDEMYVYNGSVWCNVKTIAPAASVISYLPTDNPLIMDQSWEIRVDVNAKSVDGTLTTKLYYEEEDAY